jgi:hypothetical protein
MKLRFALALLVLSLGVFVPKADANRACVYDSDCDCSGAACSNAFCCDFIDEVYCLCSCSSTPSCD